MANIILASPHLSDAGTITGSAAVGDMSLLNLQGRNLFRKYRTTNLSAQINIDLGSAQAIDFAAIVAHNGTDSGTVTIKAGTTSAVSDFTTTALDLLTGTDIGLDRNAFAHSFSAETYRYWRFDFSDTGNTDGFLEMGRLYLSNAFQPATNASYGMAEGYNDTSRIKRTVSNAIVPVIREPFKTAQLELTFATAAEMYGESRKIDRLRGQSRDIIFVPDIDDTSNFQERFIYGRMLQNPPVISEAFSIFTKTYDIEEIA